MLTGIEFRTRLTVYTGIYSKKKLFLLENYDFWCYIKCW